MNNEYGFNHGSAVEPYTPCTLAIDGRAGEMDSVASHCGHRPGFYEGGEFCPVLCR
jgi:hypothetical protein